MEGRESFHVAVNLLEGKNPETTCSDGADGKMEIYRETSNVYVATGQIRFYSLEV